MTDFKEEIQANGFSVVNHFFSKEELVSLVDELNKHKALQFDSQKTSDDNLLNIPFVKMLANSASVINNVKDEIGDGAFALNALILDKTKTSNWGLDWHQDIKIAVSRKMETPGYTQWSVESGIIHCVPPQPILEKRLAVRIHIDDCLVENGALLVVPGSHRQGILTAHKIEMTVATSPVLACEIAKGGVLFMKPLLLHKSPYSTTSQSRRILQIDYAGTALADGLQWHH